MPLIQVQLLEGRTPDQKKALLSAITDAVHDSIAAPVANIRVSIIEVPKSHFMTGGVLASERDAPSP